MENEIQVYTDIQNNNEIPVVALYGPKGDKGDKGDTGSQGVQGETGATGATGNGISSISKTSTSGVIDTYTILYTNSNTDTFTVTNGIDGINGEDGADGFSPIATVSKTGTTTTISITDKNGTTTSQVYDGTGTVDDVKVNNVSVVTSGVANITLATVATSGDYTDLLNKPSIPTVPTTLSSFTDDLGTSPVHTHSQYLTTHQDISGKADKSVETTQNIETLSSGTIALASNKSIYKLTPSAATTLTFDTTNLSITSSVAYTFELCVDMSTVYALTFPVSVSWQDATPPDLSATGTYFLVFRTIDGGTTWLGNLQGKW